jgi:hypothetical protein
MTRHLAFGILGSVLALSIFPSLIPLSALSQSGATTNQVAQWNGTSWAPGACASSPVLPLGATLLLNGRTGITTGATFEWADQSGFGNNAEQNTLAEQPTNGGMINGHNAVLFANNQSLNLVGPVGTPAFISRLVGAASPGPFTIASVWQYTGGSTVVGDGTSPIVPSIISSSAPGFWIAWNSSAVTNTSTPSQVFALGQQDYAGGTTGIVHTNGAAVLANPHYSIVTLDPSGNLSVSIDGGAVTTTTGVGATSNPNLAVIVGLGSSSTDQQWLGPIGEIDVWARALSPTEQTALGAIFVSEWGTLGP